MTRHKPKAERPHLIARLEARLHAWREHRARRRGQQPTVVPVTGYGGDGWVRVLGRVLILPPTTKRRLRRGEAPTARGWRSFVSIPVSYAPVTITVGDAEHQVAADRGGVIDQRIAADLAPGWQTIRLAVEGGESVEARIFVVDPDVRFGVVCDIDDTVMVTALPRPFLAAWNTFVLHTHARQAVPGMAVLLERLVRSHPGAPIIYLSTGAWNVTPMLSRFMERHLIPAGAMLLTDWGPTHDRWFRSGTAHKRDNLLRLAEEFPSIRWLLIGDDGQHDDEIYTTFTTEHPDAVSGVAIRRLTPTEAVFAGGRTVVDDHDAGDVPWVTEDDGAGLATRLEEVGILPPAE